jgi:hypothetical protein
MHNQELENKTDRGLYSIQNMGEGISANVTREESMKRETRRKNVIKEQGESGHINGKN